MLNVLADLALEAEAALAISLRIAYALDNSDDPRQAALVRSATGIGKYWICKRAIQHTYEAMECLGGVGYVEESVACRLYREAPVNAIWEGSGNVQCLDLLRVLNREPDTLKALLAELEEARGRHPLFDARLDALLVDLADQQDIEMRARQLMESLALLWQSATLLVYGEAWIAQAFVSARLAEKQYHQYGTLDKAIDVQAIVRRAMVTLA
jgi:putative acyl-CoA dehydrogenase